MSDPRRRRLESFVVMLVACVAACGCNAILGNEDGVFVDGAGGGPTTSSAAGEGGLGDGGSGGGTGGATGGSGGAGGAGAPCPEECEEGCFEGVCNGHLPIDVAAGAQVGCVLVKSGSLWCFGANRWGGLGIPPDEPTLDTCTTKLGGETVPCSHTPRRVDLPGTVAKVAIGFHGACAVLDDGRLFCWGNNDFGQLGHAPGERGDVSHQGSMMQPQPIEVSIPGLGAAVAVVMAGSSVAAHTCVLGQGGKLFCWGSNEYGQLGIGSWTDAAAVPPTEVAVPGGAIAISVDNSHSCAGSSTLELHCWGEAYWGGVTEGATKEMCIAGTACSTSPTFYDSSTTLANIGVVSAARSATCAITNEGGPRLRCAGYNGAGLLGLPPDSDPHPKLSAVPGIDEDAIVGLSAGDLHMCAVSADGALRCWGVNDLGQLGAGTAGGTVCDVGLPCAHVPQTVDVGGAKVARVRVGPTVSMALTEDGQVYAWGMNQGAQLGHPPGEQDDESCMPGSDIVYCNPIPHPVLGLPAPR